MTTARVAGHMTTARVARHMTIARVARHAGNRIAEKPGVNSEDGQRSRYLSRERKPPEGASRYSHREAPQSVMTGGGITEGLNHAINSHVEHDDRRQHRRRSESRDKPALRV
jgi:hypothetical protein